MAVSISITSGISYTSHNISWPGDAKHVPIDLTTIAACSKGLVRTFDEAGSPGCSPCPLNKVEFQRSQCIPKVARIGMIMPHMNADKGE
eukprot:1443237-Prymnesium_polylepis.1